MNAKEIQLEKTKEEIEGIGLEALKKYLVVDLEELQKMDKNLIVHLMHKAKLGMTFTREMNISKRATESNQIKIFKLTTNDKNELKAYINRSMPQYSPMK